MLTKFNDSNDMNTVASDAIHSYIKDGYRIDAKESVIDREKDKDCTFKAVLKKDVDGIECKTVITLSDNGDDKNKHCTYHKVETVGDTKWSEETRTFSSSTTSNTNTKDRNEFKPKTWEDGSNWLENHRNRMKRISDKYGFGWDWFDSDKFFNSFKRLSDIITSPNDPSNHDDCDKDKVNSKWTCKCPSAYKRLDDYIKVNDLDDSKQASEQDSDNKDNHIKVESHDSVDDVYNKIVNRRKNLKEACEAKARSDKQEDNLPKQDLDDDLEDSLVKLVRYIFGK